VKLFAIIQHYFSTEPKINPCQSVGSASSAFYSWLFAHNLWMRFHVKKQSDSLPETNHSN